MSGHDHHDLPEDLVPVAKLLRRERPRLDALELDALATRVRRRNERKPSGSLFVRKDVMKSRIAITMMLVLGLVMASTGGALAVSGASGEGQAAQLQYPQDDGGSAPASEGSGEPDGETLGAASNDGETLGATDEGDSNETAGAAQSDRQDDGNSGDELPFSGLAAIPVLLAGILLTVTGLALRRQVGSAKR